MKKVNSGIFMLAVSIFALLAISCNTMSPTTPATNPNSSNLTPSTPIHTVVSEVAPSTNNSAPSPPMSVEVSFPDGAPPVNQAAELRVTIKTPAMSIKDMDLKVDIPESFELI
jgi:hypothetical protein